MRIKKMNKNIVKNWTIFLILAVLLVLNSCSNFLSFEENKTAVQNDKCTITVSSDFSESEGLFSRAAFPNFVLSSETLYFAEISYTSSSSKKWLGEDSVCETAVAIKNNYSDEIRFVFCVPQETATYTFTLYACPNQTESQISAVKTSAFAQGTTTVTLSAGQKSLSSSLNIKLNPQQSSGTGTVNLPLSFDSALGIVAAKVNVTKDGVSDSSGNNYGFKIVVSETDATLSAKNAPAGTYLAIMKFYKSATDFSSLNEVAVNSAVQQVSVYSGMTTDCWFVDGKKHGTTGADGTFTPSALELTKYDFTELYVCGTDGGGEYGGNRSFYVSSNFGSSIPAASDTDGDGSMAKPFATVQKAVDKIVAANDTSKKYTVYVDGTVTADTVYGNYSANNSSFVDISPVSTLSLAIKSLSSEKAVIDAGRNGQNADTTGWRVFYIGSKANVIFENITFTGGSLDETGGGISCDGNLTLENCIVAENKSNNAGGGISFGGNELLLENTDVLSNQTEADGGGISVLNIYNSPNVTISGGKINKNKSGEKGGAINSNGIVTISGIVEILNNSASKYGGGIYFWGDGEKTVSDTKINKNSAGFGGGIYMQNGTLNLESGAIIGEELDPDDEANDISIVATSADYGNKSTDTSYSRAGAGLYVLAGTVNMSEGAYICKNYTSSYGGGVYVSPEGEFNMSGGVIGWNFSRMGGGIIADGADDDSPSYSVLNISGTAKICYNKAGFSSAYGHNGRGAGIFACGDLSISGHVEILGNYAEKSGAGIHSEKKLVMTGGSIHDNEAETDGAGIYIYSGEAELSSCTIKANKAGGNGGAIYANNENLRITVKIGEENSSDDDVLIEKNIAKRGGAFYGANNVDFEMNAGKISENYSTGSTSGDGGGAMFIWGSQSNYSTFTMNGGEISGNRAKNGGAGGAVHIDHGSGGKASFIMTGGLLSENKAADENGNGSNLGGAIYVKNGGQIKLGGSAVIDVSEESDSCNDIYLGISDESVQQKITITGKLSPGNNAAAGNQKYTARITPQTHVVGKELFQSDSYTITSDDYGKFCVTGNDVSDEWFITDAGCLSKPMAISSLSSAPDFKLYPKLTVSTASEMNKLSGFVNNGNTMAGTTVTLLNDITLDSDFQKIGNTDKPFSGTFDGNGKKIDSGTASLWAIFYQVTGGTIKNLTSSGKFSMSGIVANLSNNGLIENCTNTATVTSDTYSPLGGVCAKMEDSIIDRCVNTGSVKIEKSGEDISLGGICGSATGVIKNSTNYASVVYTGTDSNDYCFVGGILGTTIYNASVKTEFFNCINIGDVSGNEESASGIGGILGRASVLNTSVYMYNCVNMGSSSKNAIAGKYVGGVSLTGKDQVETYFTYYLEDSATPAFAWDNPKAKAYSFKKGVDLYTTTDLVTIGTLPSNDLIDLLNEWVDKKNNLSGTTQYLEWKIVDGNPALVYE